MKRETTVDDGGVHGLFPSFVKLIQTNEESAWLIITKEGKQHQEQSGLGMKCKWSRTKKISEQSERMLRSTSFTIHSTQPGDGERMKNEVNELITHPFLFFVLIRNTTPTISLLLHLHSHSHLLIKVPSPLHTPTY